MYSNALLALGSPHQPRLNVDGLTRTVRVGAPTDLARVLAVLEDQRPVSITFNDEVQDLRRDGLDVELIRDFLGGAIPSRRR